MGPGDGPDEESVEEIDEGRMEILGTLKDEMAEWLTFLREAVIAREDLAIGKIQAPAFINVSALARVKRLVLGRANFAGIRPHWKFGRNSS